MAKPLIQDTVKEDSLSAKEIKRKALTKKGTVVHIALREGSTRGARDQSPWALTRVIAPLTGQTYIGALGFVILLNSHLLCIFTHSFPPYNLKVLEPSLVITITSLTSSLWAGD